MGYKGAVPSEPISGPPSQSLVGNGGSGSGEGSERCTVRILVVSVFKGLTREESAG